MTKNYLELKLELWAKKARSTETLQENIWYRMPCYTKSHLWDSSIKDYNSSFCGRTLTNIPRPEYKENGWNEFLFIDERTSATHKCAECRAKGK